MKPNSNSIFVPQYETKWTGLLQLQNFTLVFAYEAGFQSARGAVFEPPDLVGEKSEKFQVHNPVHVCAGRQNWFMSSTSLQSKRSPWVLIHEVVLHEMAESSLSCSGDWFGLAVNRTRKHMRCIRKK